MHFLLINEKTPENIELSLGKEGFHTERLPSSHELDAPLSSHPDMLIFSSGDTVFTSGSYCEDALYIFSDVREYFPEKKIVCTSEAPGRKYPGDAIFNIRLIGDYAFLKEDTVSHTVKEYLAYIGKRIIPVKQGYPACTTLSFGNSAITADKGMARAMEWCGIKVTLIENGDITLSPYEYGFIGGASFVFEKTVYFFGKLDTHRDFYKIKSAIEDEGFLYKSLSEDRLTDLGSAILIN